MSRKYLAESESQIALHDAIIDMCRKFDNRLDDERKGKDLLQRLDPQLRNQLALFDPKTFAEVLAEFKLIQSTDSTKSSLNVSATLFEPRKIKKSSETGKSQNQDNEFLLTFLTNKDKKYTEDLVDRRIAVALAANSSATRLKRFIQTEIRVVVHYFHY